MRFFFSALAIFASVAASAQSIQFKSMKNGQIQAVGSGFTGEASSYQVNLYRNSDFLRTINTNSNGSFSYTSPASTFTANQKMVVKVLQFLGRGRHFEKSWEYRVAVEIPERKIREYANQQARTVANRVAGTYGMMENFKFNVVRGFTDAKDDALRYSRQSDPGYRKYQEGYQSGYSQGLTRGINAGESEAQSRANQMGFRDANSRFMSAVDNGEPNTSVNVPNTNYGGTSLSTATPSAYDYLNGLRYDFERGMRQFYWEYDGYKLGEFGPNWNLRAIYDLNGTYRFSGRYFKGQFAYGEWKSNRLGGKYNYNLYKKLNETQKSFFVKVFKSVYNRVIDEKFFRVRNRRNFRAYNFGENFGFRVGKKIVFHLGVKAGFSNGAIKSSIEAYANSFPVFYTNAFSKRVDFLATNPVLMLNDFSFTGEIYPTGKLNLVVKSILNYGGVRFEGAPTLSATGVVQTGSEKIELERLTSNRGEEITGNNSITISSTFPLETAQSVNVRIGNLSTRTSLKLTWNNVLKNASMNRNLNDSQLRSLKAYVFNSIKAEWDSQRGTKNLYKEGENSLLERAVKFVDYNPGSRAYFRKLAEELKTIPPRRISWIKFALKKRKKFYLRMLKGLE